MEVEEEFGRHNEMISAHVTIGDEVANDLFGMTIGIDICSIDEIATKLKIAGKNSLSISQAASPAPIFPKRHRSKGKRTHPQARCSKGNICI